MSTYLFVTADLGVLYKSGSQYRDWWSCSSTTVAGDKALVYVNGQGISWLWKVDSNARRHKEFKFVCDVERVRRISPPITIGELQGVFAKREWPVLYQNFRGHKSLKISDEIVTRIWSLREGVPMLSVPTIPEELPAQQLSEGAGTKVTVNRHERNPKARALCIQHFGPQCIVCGMKFIQRYGPNAAGYIVVHHIKPLSKSGKVRVVDPVKDLVPVCPNCHAVIHLRTPPYSVAQTRNLLRPKRGKG